jgi:predicted O-methyltransferase YrrM
MRSFLKKLLRFLHAKTLGRNPRPVGNDGRLPVAKLADLLLGQPTVTLRSLAFRDGNVSPHEILVIAALVADHAPMLVFEIGTFDGNTTLQMAENAPSGSEIITLDLPVEATATRSPIDQEDLKYIQADVRGRRRFVGSTAASKIREVFGDSAVFDFSAAIGDRKIDFAFIDGSHSFEYVKSDTERILERLAPDAIVLWHDYAPFWYGVCQYLDELQSTRTLCRIEGTTLAYYRHRIRSPDEDTALH